MSVDPLFRYPLPCLGDHRTRLLWRCRSRSPLWISSVYPVVDSDSRPLFCPWNYCFVTQLHRWQSAVSLIDLFEVRKLLEIIFRLGMWLQRLSVGWLATWVTFCFLALYVVGDLWRVPFAALQYCLSPFGNLYCGIWSFDDGVLSTIGSIAWRLMLLTLAFDFIMNPWGVALVCHWWQLAIPFIALMRWMAVTSHINFWESFGVGSKHLLFYC